MSRTYKRMDRWEGVGRVVVGGLQLTVYTGSPAVCSVVDKNSHNGCSLAPHAALLMPLTGCVVA